MSWTYYDFTIDIADDQASDTPTSQPQLRVDHLAERPQHGRLPDGYQVRCRHQTSMIIVLNH